MIKNFRVFELRYLGPTNCRGTRVKIIDNRWDESKTIPRGHNTNSLVDDAINYLEGIGIDVIGRGEGNRKDRNFLFTDNFDIGIDGSWYY